MQESPIFEFVSFDEAASVACTKRGRSDVSLESERQKVHECQQVYKGRNEAHGLRSTHMLVNGLIDDHSLNLHLNRIFLGQVLALEPSSHKHIASPLYYCIRKCKCKARYRQRGE